MADASNDCYLCGAPNEPDANHCSRCNGQLLRLPSPDPEPEPEPAITPGADLGLDDLRGDDEVSEPKKTDGSYMRRLRRKGSIEDDRLSAALGLHSSGDEAEGEPVEQVEPTIPRANPLAEMPIIGTRPVGPSKVNTRDEPGRRVYVLLGLLFLATAWLGYTTLQAPPPLPESVALADANLAPEPPPETEAPARTWSQSEVDGRYEDAFVYVELATCSQPDPTSGNSDPLSSAQSHGVAVSETVVIADLGPLPTATAARVSTRLGQQRFAILSDSETGERVIVSPTATRDFLLGQQLSGEERFQLTFDPATNAVTTSELSAVVVEPQIVVTDQGAVSSIRVGDQSLDFDELSALSGEVLVEGTATNEGDLCDWAQVLSSGVDLAPTDTIDPESDAAGQTSDPSETDVEEQQQ